jgi:hypothetical protein
MNGDRVIGPTSTMKKSRAGAALTMPATNSLVPSNPLDLSYSSSSCIDGAQVGLELPPSYCGRPVFSEHLQARGPHQVFYGNPLQIGLEVLLSLRKRGQHHRAQQ